MENEVTARLRRKLAEAIRETSEPNDSISDRNGEDCSIGSGAVVLPKQIIGDWYYVEDSLGERYIVHFINCCHTSDDYYEKVYEKGIPIPPENHGYPTIDFKIDDDTSDVCFQLLQHSVLAMNVSSIKEKFLRNPKQEVLTMDNSNEAAIAARRRALAEALRTGEPVVVTASGEVEKQEDAQQMGMTGIQVPDGKLA